MNINNDKTKKPMGGMGDEAQGLLTYWEPRLLLTADRDKHRNRQ